MRQRGLSPDDAADLAELAGRAFAAEIAAADLREVVWDKAREIYDDGRGSTMAIASHLSCSKSTVHLRVTKTTRERQLVDG
jgi:DNA invertase Pin-like site-specific DNA recombinase